MKTLMFLRHGEAEDFYSANDDHSRNLTELGLMQSENIGSQILSATELPDIVFSSDSNRTKGTWDQVSQSLGDIPVSFHQNLYLSDHENVFNHLFSLSDEINRVLFIGHNPTWSSISSQLSGVGIAMSPADCVVLENSSFQNWNEMPFTGSWQLVQKLKAKL